jgi:hypothetical protein
VGNPLPQHLAPITPVFFAFVLQHRAPLRFCLVLASCFALLRRSAWLPRNHHGDRPAVMAPFDGDGVRVARA